MMHTSCVNCGAAMKGKYCFQCGQKDQPDQPELHHFLHELVHEFLHVDGKIFRAVKLLVLSPGKLTLEYWSGRRVSNVAPLRLYLIVSVLMFGLISLLPNVRHVPFEPTIMVSSSDYDNGKMHDILDLPVEKRKEIAHGVIGPTSRFAYFREPMTKAIAEPMEFRHRLLSNASKTMFVLLPLFSLITLIAFRRSGRVYL